MQIDIQKTELESGLYVVATPLGNLKDISIRALEILKSVDFIWCEDKRISVRLLQAYQIESKLFTYHEHNGDQEMPNIIAKLNDGAKVALISDAGTPLISDPGMKLIAACREAGHKAIPVPGCSAPITALCVSGLPTNRFLFEGFLPPKQQKKQAAFEKLKHIDASLIFFESPKRLLSTLEMICDLFPERDVTVARELTKIYEDIKCLPAQQMFDYYSEKERIRGEIVLILSPPKTEIGTSDQDIEQALLDALAQMRVKDAAKFVSEQLGLPKKQIYQKALELKDQND